MITRHVVTVHYVIEPPIECVGVGSWSSYGRERKYRADSAVAEVDRAGRVSVRYGGSVRSFMSDDPALDETLQSVLDDLCRLGLAAARIVPKR